MRVDAMLAGNSIKELAAEARGREAAGYDGLWSFEAAHDPFLPLMPVAEHTEHVSVGTAIAVAFSRNPMSMAYVAHDVQVHSEGRLLLGLGSQVKPHIERRFQMPWSHPAPRMREYVLALRAIWSAWDDEERLDFRGDFYSHTLMTPFFCPARSPWGPPKVYLAAVGQHMTRVAGEVCDGIQPHAFTTERYLRERTLPLLTEGLTASGRTLDDFSISFGGFVVTGRTEEEMATAAAGMRQQIACYGSTPSYRTVLELHGWGELGVELNMLSRGTDPERWQKMGDLIDDEVLRTFAVIAEPDALGPALLERYGDIVDRFTFYAWLRGVGSRSGDRRPGAGSRGHGGPTSRNVDHAGSGPGDGLGRGRAARWTRPAEVNIGHDRPSGTGVPSSRAVRAARPSGSAVVRAARS